MVGMGVSLEESMLSSVGDTVNLSCWENLGMEPSSGARGAPGASGLCVSAAPTSWPFTRLLWPECSVKDLGPTKLLAPGLGRRGGQAQGGPMAGLPTVQAGLLFPQPHRWTHMVRPP